MRELLINSISRIEGKRFSLMRDSLFVISFAVLTGIAASVKVEIGIVPVTLQTFIVFLSGGLLGKNRGALSQLTYLLGGLSGIPWFSRGGGLQYVFSPTFGYLIGFVFAAFFIGWAKEKGFARTFWSATFFVLIGNVILYALGLLWLTKFVSSGKILSVGLYPFIAGDVLKIISAGFLINLWSK